MPLLVPHAWIVLRVQGIGFASISTHLLALSAFRPGGARSAARRSRCLNAPSGAQCSPTRAQADGRDRRPIKSQCTFWCPVLSDRLARIMRSGFDCRSQCTFWCSVLSDGRRMGGQRRLPRRVSMHRLMLSAFRHSYHCSLHCCLHCSVSMHLLVLGAFRHCWDFGWFVWGCCGLNAPSGAWCFPT